MYDQYLTPTGRLSTTQPQELKNSWYIGRFNLVHANIYDYSLVEYRTNRLKVRIICKNHGIFLQSPHDHLKGHGCPSCSGNTKKDSAIQTQDFIQIHGDTYEYPQVHYENNKTKIDILCKIHGIFQQQPTHHLRGHGCPKCQVNNQNTLYLLRCKRTNLVKIGITNSIHRRVPEIGDFLEIIHIFYCDNPREIEHYLHKKYQQYNVYNTLMRGGNTEFFNLSTEQIQEIINDYQT